MKVYLVYGEDNGKDRPRPIKEFDTKKAAIKHACKCMILMSGEQVFEVWEESSNNGLIYDVEKIFTTAV